MSEVEPIEEGLGDPTAREKIGRFSKGALQVVENMPGTSLTGPSTLPGHAFPWEDFVGAINDIRRIMRMAPIQSLASDFRVFRKSMEEMGYDFIESRSSKFGGYFRRPAGNPGNLPDPKEINEMLKEEVR